MSLQIYDLTHTYGQFMPEWPSHPGVDIDVLKFHARDGVYEVNWEGIMHRGTHMDAPLHVTENTPDIMDYPLWQLCGTGVCVSIPKEKWGIITPEDLEAATPKIQEGDIVMINTGFHHKWADCDDYFAYGCGINGAGANWLVEHKVKLVGYGCQANDHPLATKLVDHMGYVLFPWILWLRCVGRIAFPIFAFQIAEGCIRTHDRRRYALRLLLFAVLTEVPFDLAFNGQVLYLGYQNVLWTLLAGALVCWAADWAQRTPDALHLLAATAAFAGAFWLLEVCHTDYGGWGMALIVLFHLSRGNRLIQLAGLAVFCVASAGGVSIELYALVSLAFIWLYDGRRGYCSRPIQWLCYAFYPVHLLLLWLYARTVDGIWYLT